MCAGAVALSSIDSRSPDLALTTSVLALAALLAFAEAVAFPAPGLVGPALGFLGTLVVVHLLLLGPPDVVSAGLAGIGLLAAGELAQWSIDTRHPGRYDRRVHVARGWGIADLVLRGMAVVAVGAAAAALPVSGGIELMVIASAAAVGLFGLTAFAAARAR